MGFSIAIEGIDRIGKGTQIKKLMEDPDFKKLNMVYTREPGGDEVAEAIRSLVKDKSYFGKINALTEALLYASSRAQHTQEKLIPLSKEDNIIICDRYVHSSLVYQGMRKGINDSEIIKMNEIAMRDFNLDYCIIFYMEDNEKLKERFSSLAGSEDRIEMEGTEFFVKANARYRGFPFNEIFTNTKHLYVNCDGSVDEVYENLKYVFKYILIQQAIKEDNLKVKLYYTDSAHEYYTYTEQYKKKTRVKKANIDTAGPNRFYLNLSNKDLAYYNDMYQMEAFDKVELSYSGCVVKSHILKEPENSTPFGNKDLSIEYCTDANIFKGM